MVVSRHGPRITSSLRKRVLTDGFLTQCNNKHPKLGTTRDTDIAAQTFETEDASLTGQQH